MVIWPLRGPEKTAESGLQEPRATGSTSSEIRCGMGLSDQRGAGTWSSAAGPGTSKTARIRRRDRAGQHLIAGPAGQLTQAQGGDFRPARGDHHRDHLATEQPSLIIGHLPGNLQDGAGPPDGRGHAAPGRGPSRSTATGTG